MIKGVLFDLDGTLLNRDQSVLLFINRQYERLREFVGHIPKEAYSAKFLKLDNHGYVWKDKVYQEIVNEFRIQDITWKELLHDYISEFKNDCIPYPFLKFVLEELKRKNIVLGIISNGREPFQKDNIKALDLENYFDTILVSEAEGIKKPNPEIFKRALDRLNVSPHESVFVGDHLENDVKAAQNAGMKGIWKTDSNKKSDIADFIIQELTEIPAIIESLNKQSVKIH